VILNLNFPQIERFLTAQPENYEILVVEIMHALVKIPPGPVMKSFEDLNKLFHEPPRRNAKFQVHIIRLLMN
jgi:hypothetical protein